MRTGIKYGIIRILGLLGSLIIAAQIGLNWITGSSYCPTAGCEVVDEMMDAFWGDRMGMVKDPFGHCWAIASHKWVLTEEEMQKGMEDWLKSLPQ